MLVNAFAIACTLRIFVKTVSLAKERKKSIRSSPEDNEYLMPLTPAGFSYRYVCHIHSINMEHLGAHATFSDSCYPESLFSESPVIKDHLSCKHTYLFRGNAISLRHAFFLFSRRESEFPMGIPLAGSAARISSGNEGMYRHPSGGGSDNEDGSNTSLPPGGGMSQLVVPMIKLEDMYESIPEQYIIPPITEEGEENDEEKPKHGSGDISGARAASLSPLDRKQRGSSGHSIYVGDELLGINRYVMEE